MKIITIDERTGRTKVRHDVNLDDKGEKVPTRTQQQFKAECDINNIMAKYKKTGVLPSLIKADPRYGDFSDVLDYQESLNIVMHANDQFAALSAKVRRRFDNDPAKFLEFTADPKNAEEMIDLGLATRKLPEAPINDSQASGADSKPVEPVAKPS